MGMTVRGLRASVPSVLFCVAAAFVGCEDDDAIEEAIRRSFDTGPAPHVVATSFNGSIIVLPSDDGGVRIVAIKRAWANEEDDAEDALKDIDVDFSQEGDTIQVVATGPQDSRRGIRIAVNIEIEAPAGASLVLETTNAEIAVEDIEGDITATTDNGRICVDGAMGELVLTATNGQIDVTSVKGALIDARTTNGAIEARGALGPGIHSMETTNGGIDVRLPADAVFFINAETTNGSIATDFPLRVQSSNAASSVSGQVGVDPLMRLDLKTTNGSISIEEDR